MSWDDALARPVAHDRRWIDDQLPADFPRDCRHVVGHLVPEAIRHAERLGAGIVVLSSEVGRSGSCVSAISSAGVCVLSAAAPTHGDAIEPLLCALGVLCRDGEFDLVVVA